LSKEWRLSLDILLHFLDFIFNHNVLIDHVLKIGIDGVRQLELNVIIQHIQEHVLLLLIHVDIVRGVSQQLLVQFHSVIGHVVGTEMSLEFIPCNRADVYVGLSVCLPPVCCCSKELVHGKKNFLMIRALGDHKLSLNSLEPIFGLHGVLSLRETGGVSL
jgi:hypothetical protein